MTSFKFVLALYALMVAVVASLCALTYFINDTVIPDTQERGVIAIAEASQTAWFTFPAAGIVLPGLFIWLLIKYRDDLIGS